MTFRFAFKTSFGHLQDVLARCLACLGTTSLRHLVGVFLPTGFVGRALLKHVTCGGGGGYTYISSLYAINCKNIPQRNICRGLQDIDEF